MNIIWTDSYNGTPYAWTSRATAISARKELAAQGIETKAERIESYCYHLVSVHDDNLFISQETGAELERRFFETTESK